MYSFSIRQFIWDYANGRKVRYWFSVVALQGHNMISAACPNYPACPTCKPKGGSCPLAPLPPLALLTPIGRKQLF